ncbi:hypothetical protein EON65_13950 [archaeon]|nr:MAG: hypothetical protein EON65_13950 [archaeon]
MSPSPMHAMALILLLLFSSSTTKGFHSSYSSKSIKNLLLQAEQEADRSPQPTQQSTISPFGFIFVRNLKSAGQNPSRDAKLVQSWKEMNGLSEKSFVLNPAQLVGPDGRAQALDLAYRRCEDVTQLFSKTFYVGSSFIPSEARKHVWAIYAWCRRTDDLVDSPRTLLARDTLQTDLRHWEQRLEAIWRDEPLDLFDLAMADTVKAYPGMRIQPFKDMIAGTVFT